MFDPSVSKSRLFFKQLILLSCLLLAVFIDRTSFFDFLPVQPLLSLPVMYYWSLYRPDWVSLFGILGIGLIDDILSGVYLGQNTILFLLIYTIVLKQMDYFINAGFAHTWGAFFIIMGVCGFIQWGISSFLYQEPINIFLLAGQNIATVLMFPIVYSVLNKIALYTYDWD